MAARVPVRLSCRFRFRVIFLLHLFIIIIAHSNDILLIQDAGIGQHNAHDQGRNEIVIDVGLPFLHVQGRNGRGRWRRRDGGRISSRRIGNGFIQIRDEIPQVPVAFPGIRIDGAGDCRIHGIAAFD